jgi:SAM-dependent methyltransferase
MKLCIRCGLKFNSAEWGCPSCHFTPPLVENHLSFAPELAKANDGFEPSYFEVLANIEANHFWFTSRNHLIIWVLKRYFPEPKNFLEIGCGTGFVLSAIENTFPGCTLYGSEVYSAGLNFAAKRLRRTNLFQMDARHIPFVNEFDIIGAFDLLEHVEQDEVVLSQVYKALLKGGGIILTVPQHPFLSSLWDEMSCHKRRYTRHELLDKLRTAGFRVLWITSFVTLLLPMLVVSRLRWRLSHFSHRRSEDLKDLNLPSLINNLFQKVCDIEGSILKKGVSFPVGGSLFCIGLKE